MRISLRNIVLAPALLAVASLAAVSAHADVALKVPFAFTAAGKSCPAGNYVVSKDLAHNVVKLRNVDDGRSFAWQVRPGSEDAAANMATLRFNATGNHELLSVQYGSSITSRLDKSRHSEHVPVETIAGQ